jgi:hypothetical protein
VQPSTFARWQSSPTLLAPVHPRARQMLRLSVCLCVARGCVGRFADPIFKGDYPESMRQVSVVASQLSVERLFYVLQFFHMILVAIHLLAVSEPVT